MRKTIVITILLVACFALVPCLTVAQEQVHSQASVTYASYTRLYWSFGGDGTVPHGKHLVITNATFAYFPTGDGTVGRVDFAGREADSAVFRLQVIYVEPKKTLYLSFPGGLILNEGGYAEIGAPYPGDEGTIFVSVNGHLVDKLK